MDNDGNRIDYNKILNFSIKYTFSEILGIFNQMKYKLFFKLVLRDIHFKLKIRGKKYYSKTQV